MTTDATVPLLRVRDLSLQFRTRSGIVNALDRVGLELAKGEIVGLVGESGSGKSVLSYAVLGISDSAARVISGEAMFGGLDLLRAREAELQEIRGREVSMIFQNPRAALNPIRKVGLQIEDVLRRHAAVPRDQLRDKAIATLAQVRIPDPARRYHAYPFELSGGLCQRIMIAMALACSPSLLIADEPTTGLDVTTQAAIMALITEQAKSHHMATLLITHDLGLAAEYCDRIIVMHAGQVVEQASAAELFERPRHPYTAQLVKSTPHGCVSLDRLAAIPGTLPDLRRTDLPPCRFSERCERVQPACVQPLPAASSQGLVACWNPL